MLDIIPLYAAALGLLFLILSVRVIVVRRRENFDFGAERGSDLERRVRTHANFAEYTPFALLLLAMAELRGSESLWLHAGGIALLVGRLAHAWGVARPTTDEIGRIAGMAGSQTAILIAILLIVGSIL